MKIVISSGHGKYVRGAAGSPIPPYLDERDENVRVVDEVARILNGAGIQTTVFHDNVSTTQNENLNRIVNFHNSKTRDWDVSVHFNSYQTTPTPMGTEVLYVSSTGGTMARTVVDKIAENGLTNRGPKQRTDLFFLNNTEMPAILIEVCFVDSKADCGVYREEFTPICYSIAEGLAGHPIDESLPEQPPIEPPPTGGNTDSDAIAAIAARSEIANYNWPDRGVAPPGYIKGFALAWAQCIEKFNAGDTAVRNMARANTHNGDVDVLEWYADAFKLHGMANDVDGLNTLRHLFALQLGLGMRESSGKHCEGRDMSASNVTAETAEAGLYQTSYNARSASSPYFVNVMDAYKAGTRKGYLGYFREGVICSQSAWNCYGSGEGYVFQEMCKSEPAFAVETCALTLRNLRQHYGPINRKEAQLKEEADWMLLDVQRYLASREAVA